MQHEDATNREPSVDRDEASRKPARFRFRSDGDPIEERAGEQEHEQGEGTQGEGEGVAGGEGGTD